MIKARWRPHIFLLVVADLMIRPERQFPHVVRDLTQPVRSQGALRFDCGLVGWFGKIHAHTPISPARVRISHAPNRLA